MNFKKIIVCGSVAGLAGFMVGSILYMNPLISAIYSSTNASACSKSMELFGGTGNWLFLMLLGGIISTIFVAVLYSYTEKAFGTMQAWKKGALFGIILWLVAKLPNSYYIWLLYNYPDIMNIIETFNGLVGAIVTGIVLAYLYEKIK